MYRPVDRAWVSAEALEEAVRSADYALLGEQHDNLDHHRLQARLVAISAERTPAPVVAWEMFDTEQQEPLDAFVAAHGTEPGAAMALGPALGFERTGWPAWSMYAPIAEVALTKHLRLLGANLSRQMAKGLVFHGASVLPEGATARLGLDRPMDPAALASLKRELSDAHCGHLPASHTDAMVLAQRARDATLAERLLDGSARGVLIAGAGHARGDRGVGALVREAVTKASKTVVTIAFVEVTDGETEPAAYAARFHPVTEGGPLPFDFVWFTPRASDEDPCAGMKVPPKKASTSTSSASVAARLTFEPARAPGDFGLPKESAARRQALVELATWNEGGRGPDQKWHAQPRVVIGEPVELVGGKSGGKKGASKPSKGPKKPKKGGGKKGASQSTKQVDESTPASSTKRSGGWDTRGAMRALRKYAYSGVRRCFDAALRETPDLEGRTVVDIQVDGSGRIVSAQASSGRAPDPRKHQTGMKSGAVRSCIASALRSVAVPPARGKRVSARVSVDVWPGDAPIPAVEPPPLASSLPPATFNPWLAAQRPAVEACFAKLADRAPGTWGRLVLRVDVAQDSTIQASEFDSTFPDTDTTACVIRSLVEAPTKLPAHDTPSRVVLALRFAQPGANPSAAPPAADDDSAAEHDDPADSSAGSSPTGDGDDAESSESPAAGAK